MKELEKKLGYSFQNIGLLRHALTHSSYANEHRNEGITSNERLEFLGDSVLGMVVADHLYHAHPEMSEGILTRTRAALVCEESLHDVAIQLDLGRYLRLGKGENAGGGRERASILADAVEAILAAVYLDGGISVARQMIQKFILDQEAVKSENRDYKTALQELVQRKPGVSISYHTVRETGPDHRRMFVMEVKIDGVATGQGEGHTKKEAEQMAAKAAIHALKQ